MIMVLSPLDENLPKDAETCDFNDSLEDLIEPSEGEAHKSYEVLKDNKPVVVLHMKDSVKALVLQRSSSDFSESVKYFNELSIMNTIHVR
jgi:hypothetical protein